MTETDKKAGKYLMLLSVHGLIRGHNLELGRDADTGGQTKYVVELARALAEHPEVERVDLVTRSVIDNKVDSDYAQPIEELGNGAYIVRLPCGPRRYLRKEVLWPYLDSFADNVLQHLRKIGRLPDLIHSHYADAGYVAARLTSLLGIPMVHTGHSLGRVKEKRLIANGVKLERLESQYNMSRRIEAEEVALENASLVITSTHQEIEEQYRLYDDYVPDTMVVIPPGVDLERFHPPKARQQLPPVAEAVDRFLDDPKKPMILALSRPDERKNIHTLVEAYAENTALRDLANLVVIAGNRDDIGTMDKGSRDVLTDLLFMIDRYDLYGAVAYPKHHKPNDVPDLYRLAARRKGVFINPALTEPFGLTLIEAAASGLPIIATNDGGPRDIIGFCKNGLLIDPLDADAMGEALLAALSNKQRWQRWAKAGLTGVHKHYSWQGHAAQYMKRVKPLIKQTSKTKARKKKSRLPTVERLVVCDIDNTLLGNADGLQQLIQRINDNHDRVGFGVATGRRLDSALQVLKKWKVPQPDVLITAVGTEIHYGHGLVMDDNWGRHINQRWHKGDIHKLLHNLPGLKLQPATEQREYKLSYYIDPAKAPSRNDIVKLLRRHDIHANVIYSHGQYLDLLPLRASKGRAMRYIGEMWGINPDHILVAGDSGNDEEMLRGNTLAVVVGNYSDELKTLRDTPRIYFAKGQCAYGVLEGIEYYDFFGDIAIPNDEGLEI
ncbi:MAG: HAD-IIB family hydrolase [Granulosicoccaceae bacterium]|jgi:sucrose-phosphate synthase